MSTIKITSIESLDSHVAEVVRLKIEHTAITAEMEEKIAGLRKEYAPKIGSVADRISDKEDLILAYCDANRELLFPDKKSRESLTATIGFEFTPYRVETSAKKITWKVVIKRALRLAWAKVYVRKPAPQVDKNALLADREKLTPVQLVALGIQFDRDEQFFIRPKSEIATDTVKREEAA